MNKRLLFPLMVVAVMALASLACITVNVYDGSAPVRPTSSPAEVAAAQQQGQYFLGAIGTAIYILIGGFSFLSKKKINWLFGTVYWLLLIGGLLVFGDGVLVFRYGFTAQILIGAGGLAMLLSVPWALWGDRLF